MTRTPPIPRLTQAVDLAAQLLPGRRPRAVSGNDRSATTPLEQDGVAADLHLPHHAGRLTYPPMT